MEFTIPKGMLMGVSTAATQIEGGNVNSNWNDWYQKGFIKDSTDPATGNDHWEKWQADTELMSQMGLQLYRFGVEWARLMPQQGYVDEEAVSRYRQELLALKEKGIRPLLTIHHFSNPMWFENKGAFRKRENLKDYLELAELCVRRFGDLCSDFITINEPNVYTTNSYMFGIWPPGRKSLADTIAVMENLAWCHLKAYSMIHKIRRDMGYTDTMVGCANHMRVFAPKSERNPWHRLCAKLSSYLFQDALSRAMTLGRFPLPLRNFGKIPAGEYTDFIGLNYYTRSTVSNIGDGVRQNSPRNDLDWEIYPQGIVQCAQKLYTLLPRPIWVTENGTCDANDRFRCRYLYEHLKELSSSKLPFQRYYHWCFCDNFEWVEGNTAKFGLVEIDPATRLRTIKASGAFYSEIIANSGVTAAMFEKYVAQQTYDVR